MTAVRVEPCVHEAHLSLFLPNTTVPGGVCGGRTTKVSHERGILGSGDVLWVRQPCLLRDCLLLRICMCAAAGHMLPEVKLTGATRLQTLQRCMAQSCWFHASETYKWPRQAGTSGWQ